MTSLSKLRICAQPFITQDNREINTLKMQSANPQHFQKLQAAFFKSKLWSKGSTIKIEFLENKGNAEWSDLAGLERLAGGKGKLDPLEYELRKLPTYDLVVKKVVEERIQPLVDLKLVFVPRGNGNIRIGFDNTSGAWSLLGTDCKMEQGKTMNFGWIDVGTIIHEFGHAIGLIHEHQNPKGGIKWDVPKVLAWAAQTQGWDESTARRNIIDAYSIESLNATEFDPKSIMLYFFPGELTLTGKGTKPNFILSERDVNHIYSVYEGEMNPSEFYDKFYGKKLDTDKGDGIEESAPSSSSSRFTVPITRALGHKSLKDLIWIIIILIILIMIANYMMTRTEGSAGSKSSGSGQESLAKLLSR